MDAVVFSGESIPAGHKVWSNARHPLKLKPGVDGGDYCAMLGAASAKDGKLHYHLKKAKGINQDDVVDFLRTISKYYRPRKLAVLCDNGSSFRANSVKWAATDLDI